MGIKKNITFRLCFLLTIFIGVSVHVFVANILPILKIRDIEKIMHQIDPMIKKCNEEGRACSEDVMKEVRSLEMQARSIDPFFIVTQREEFLKEMKHADGSYCQFVREDPDAPDLNITDAELSKWLDSFGRKRFLDLAEVIFYAKHIYEERYHGPNPDKTRLDIISRLKWRHFPLGSEWRLYNTAEIQMRPVLDYHWPIVPDDLREILLPEYLAHPEYFKIKNLMRLLRLADGETTATSRQGD